MTLTADDVTLRVPGRTLVQNLTCSLSPGAYCAVLGRNGSGKTNLLLALAGLRPCDRGDIRIEGAPLATLGRERIAQRIGVLLQDETESYWGTVDEYVALGAMPRETGWLRREEAPADAVAGAIAAMDLAGHTGRLYRTLSGGERQRARIAQLLLQDPQVFLLDEPLTHLDLGHQLLVMEHFAALARSGRIVVLSLHDPAWAARYCDQALLLYDSPRFDHGPAPQVLTQARLEALYGCRLRTVAPDDRTLLFPSV